MKLSNLAIRIAIIEKLVKHRIWGGKHTAIDNVPKGFPPHLRKEVLDETKALIKEGILIAKPTAYGLEISLNPCAKEYIERLLMVS